MPIKNVLYLSLTQYRTLVQTGTITISGTTYTYNTNDMYCVEDNIVSMTQAEYDALATKDPDIYYFIED